MFGSGAEDTEPNIEMNTGLFIFVDDYIILRPHMSKSNLQYLAFDDRKLILFGIPILTLAIPFLFWGLELDFYLSIAHVEFFEDIVYTAAYWFFNRYLIIWLRKRFGPYVLTYKRFVIQLLIILICSPIIGWIATIVTHSIYDITGLQDMFEPSHFQSGVATYFLTFFIATLYEAIYFFFKYNEAILEKEQIQRAHIQGQLDNLRNQINPHFLFNSMNTLMNLIPADPERAMNYLSKLSKFYRYTVSNQEQSLVPLQTELDNVRIYSELLRERFHQGIQVRMPVQVEGNPTILPLCLQLLIENAVKHNIVASKKPLTIDIQIIQNGKYIKVKNNIQRKIQEVSSTGMGIKNIKNRVSFFTEDPLIITEDDEFFAVSVPLIY
jgi:two-component system LytT family sensor kinase